MGYISCRNDVYYRRCHILLYKPAALRRDFSYFRFQITSTASHKESNLQHTDTILPAILPYVLLSTSKHALPSTKMPAPIMPVSSVAALSDPSKMCQCGSAAVGTAGSNCSKCSKPIPSS
ncbi:hypothetical protein CPLU01_15418 [Colletotrichum plurivorum]|uniref:Uncharacterized protein n=1 Tax=Colletotrichum plurivorum TaxID=2175906 RepID=A0A8H6JC83_9PEZI|nr:hypothetical protein CPLU01_15418 [Colletotrichum plurivorum]